LTAKDKIYFISDVHLGLYPLEESIERERIMVNWLRTIKEDTSELYLLGDIFDYEFQVIFAKNNQAKEHDDFYIFGHRLFHLTYISGKTAGS
jgi:UDP-2,3-diacylglucosamine pyrophosphatase LpxH